ncbi:MAG: hypothetical protein LBI30_03060 [Holosporales bacterium]|nr:hypothetical protein [Holosporales bacterium]
MKDSISVDKDKILNDNNYAGKYRTEDAYVKMFTQNDLFVEEGRGMLSDHISEESTISMWFVFRKN